MANFYCSVHGVKCTWKEGGVTKDGRPYKGFYACPEKDAQGNFCKAEKNQQDDWIDEIGKFQASPNTPPEVEKATDWDAIAEGKVRHGVAVAFIGLLATPMKIDEQLIEQMESWVRWIMSGQ